MPKRRFLGKTEESDDGTRIALLIVVVLGVAAHLLALTCSGPSPDIVGAKAAWKLGAIIKVTASNFPPALQPCVQKAFDNWNAANPSTNANGNASDVKAGPGTQVTVF